MAEIVINAFTLLTTDILESIVEMDRQIFDVPLSKEIILQELDGKKDLLGLIAHDGNNACGFKIGFQQSPEVFNSWVGGVIPEYRRRGIAAALLQEQHRILKEMNYKYVRTSTKNKYREMLLLNIKFGFDVTGVQKKLRESQQSIILEKEL